MAPPAWLAAQHRSTQNKTHHFQQEDGSGQSNAAETTQTSKQGRAASLLTQASAQSLAWTGLEQAPEMVLGVVELEYPERRRKGNVLLLAKQLTQDEELLGDPLGLAFS